MKRIVAALSMFLLAGCEVLDPPRATTLSPLPPLGSSVAPLPSDSFSGLLLPYPAAKITERSQVPVGDYLRSTFRKNFPNADVVVKAWEPKSEVRGTFGPHVVMNLGFELTIQEAGKQRAVADYLTSDLGPLYVSHFSITGLNSIDSHERAAPIHAELRIFLDLVVEKVKWRLREKEERKEPNQSPEPTAPSGRGSS